MAVLYANNASSVLASGITNTATSLTVSSGQGDRFPSPTNGDYFPATIEKPDGSLEIVRVTARSGDTLTVTRAQEGTTALSFDAGSLIELRLTAATIESLASSSGGASIPVGSAVWFPSSDNYYNVDTQVWQRMNIATLPYSSTYHDLAAIPAGLKDYWSLATSPFSNQVSPQDICSTGSGFAAVYSVFVSTSTDGTTWTTPVSAGGFAPDSIHYVNGTYFVFGSSGTAAKKSTDGVNWTVTTTGQPNTIYDMIWTGTYYVAVSSSNSYYSTDGVAWTTISGVGGYAIAKVGSTYVMMGATAGVARTSSDGISWTNRSIGVADIYYSCASDGTTLLALGSDTNANSVVTTTDGITWTLRSTGSDLRANFRRRVINTATGEFYIFGNRAVYKTTDSGVTITPVGLDSVNAGGIGQNTSHAYYNGTFLRKTSSWVAGIGSGKNMAVSSGFSGTPLYIGVGFSTAQVNDFMNPYVRTK